ncbi:hypothetical protein DSO57_1009242, partial [Entomophthora muscae]
MPTSPNCHWCLPFGPLLERLSQYFTGRHPGGFSHQDGSQTYTYPVVGPPLYACWTSPSNPLKPTSVWLPDMAKCIEVWILGA